MPWILMFLSSDYNTLYRARSSAPRCWLMEQGAVMAFVCLHFAYTDFLFYIQVV